MGSAILLKYLGLRGRWLSWHHSCFVSKLKCGKKQ